MVYYWIAYETSHRGLYIQEVLENVHPFIHIAAINETAETKTKSLNEQRAESIVTAHLPPLVPVRVKLLNWKQITEYEHALFDTVKEKMVFDELILSV